MLLSYCGLCCNSFKGCVSLLYLEHWWIVINCFKCVALTLFILEIIVHFSICLTAVRQTTCIPSMAQDWFSLSMFMYWSITFLRETLHWYFDLRRVFRTRNGLLLWLRLTVSSKYLICFNIFNWSPLCWTALKSLFPICQWHINKQGKSL